MAPICWQDTRDLATEESRPAPPASSEVAKPSKIFEKLKIATQILEALTDSAPKVGGGDIPNDSDLRLLLSSHLRSGVFELFATGELPAYHPEHPDSFQRAALDPNLSEKQRKKLAGQGMGALSTTSRHLVTIVGGPSCTTRIFTDSKSTGGVTPSTKKSKKGGSGFNKAVSSTEEDAAFLVGEFPGRPDGENSPVASNDSTSYPPVRWNHAYESYETLTGAEDSTTRATQGKIRIVTTRVPAFEGVIDYIWYRGAEISGTTNTIRVESILDLPREDSDCYYPNEVHPSDHLPIGAAFCFE